MDAGEGVASLEEVHPARIQGDAQRRAALTAHYAGKHIHRIWWCSAVSGYGCDAEGDKGYCYRLAVLYRHEDAGDSVWFLDRWEDENWWEFHDTGRYTWQATTRLYPSFLPPLKAEALPPGTAAWWDHEDVIDTEDASGGERA